MKKIISIITLASFNFVFASDPITIDSLFKDQTGIRSITNISLLSTGNANRYNLYPTLQVNDSPVILQDTKQLSINQTLIYNISQHVNFFTSFGGSYSRHEYTDLRTFEPRSKNQTRFNSLWVGLNYKGNNINGFIPVITFQTAVLQKDRFRNENKSFYFNSYSLKGALKGYSDPAIYSIYASFNYNAPKKFSFAKISYGNTFAFGGDLSIVLSPKITLDLGIEQRFQTEQKVNNKKTTNLRSIPTYSVGSTYSIDKNNSISFNAILGGSSSAPSSVFSVSLWKKF